MALVLAEPVFGPVFELAALSRRKPRWAQCGFARGQASADLAEFAKYSGPVPRAAQGGPPTPLCPK